MRATLAAWGTRTMFEQSCLATARGFASMLVARRKKATWLRLQHGVLLEKVVPIEQVAPSNWSFP